MITKLETLKDLIQEHKQLALERFKEGSETPFIVGYSGTQRMAFPLFYRNDSEKEQVLQMVTLGFIAMDVKRYTFDSQGYSLSYSEGTDYQAEYNKLKQEGKSIKDHPNHIEVFMCGAISHTEKIMQVFEITKDFKGEKILKDLQGEELQQASGRFTELLPPKEIDPKLKEEIKAHFEMMVKQLPIRIDDIIH
jgi:hypothetical protein